MPVSDVRPAATAPDVYVARQPIFGLDGQVEGYELLFRADEENACTNPDGDAATLEVISSSLMLFGLERLAHGHRAYIKFTEALLLAAVPTLLPADQVVVEIPNDVTPSPELLAACQALRDQGYLLALDGFALQPNLSPFVALVDIIKVDVQELPREKWDAAVGLPTLPGAKFLAQKVETPEEREAAEKAGFHLFQGYFYARPNVLSSRNLSAAEVHCLEAFREVSKPDIDFDRIADVIKRDVSFSYKLLRFINSAAIGMRTRIHSIRQALTLLGQKETARWLSLVALRDMGRGKPDELMVTCILRARMGELLAGPALMRNRSSDLFLLGVFSAIDALVDRPAEEVIRELPLPEDIQEALLGEPNRIREVLDLILAYESGDWVRFAEWARTLGIPESTVPAIYVDAVAWAHEFLPES
ncbi:MAG TPA: HDOD domain-containing protein [Armatimonadota bacterium]|jgi:EAL and modified HD-GYP domain-containing signal transduction protein